MKIPTFSAFVMAFFITPVWSAPKPPIIQFQVAPLTQARISIGDRLIMVSINRQSPQVVAPIEPYLWEEYRNGYLKYGDFDGDKVQELAILASLSYGATNPCYNIYHYSPTKQRFLPSGEPMRCDLP